MGGTCTALDVGGGRGDGRDLHWDVGGGWGLPGA